MNNQEFFNESVTKIYQQNAVSMDEFGECLYRGPNNLKCAVGVCIPDNLYQPEMERHGVGTLHVDFPIIRNLFNGVDKVLMGTLQTAHDHANSRKAFDQSFRDYWIEKTTKIAKEFGLTMPELPS